MSALTRAMYAKRGLPLASAEKPVDQSDWEMKVAAGGAGGVAARCCARAAPGRLIARATVIGARRRAGNVRSLYRGGKSDHHEGTKVTKAEGHHVARVEHVGESKVRRPVSFVVRPTTGA